MKFIIVKGEEPIIARDVMKTECDKIVEAQERSIAISEFLQWMDTQKIVLCSWKETEESGFCSAYYQYTDRTKEQLLGDFFGIDLKKAEEERKEILRNLR